MINVEKGTKLLNYLMDLKESQFDYSVGLCSFENDDFETIEQRFVFESLKTDHPCKTVGCIAGNCCILFSDEIVFPSDPRKRINVFDTAQTFLGLNNLEADFLFFEFCEISNKDDAILRLKHLLNGKYVEDYDWSKESNFEEKEERIIDQNSLCQCQYNPVWTRTV